MTVAQQQQKVHWVQMSTTSAALNCINHQSTNDVLLRELRENKNKSTQKRRKKERT
jgi:hypothetical protein